MKHFTVIGYYADTGQIFCDHVQAVDAMHAFWVAAHQRYCECEVEFVACIEGCLAESRDEIAFPGDSTVSSSTVLDQLEVFCNF